MTPIRVSHELVLQVFYSIAGKSIGGKPISGPGELRAMVLKLPVVVPSVSELFRPIAMAHYGRPSITLDPPPGVPSIELHRLLHVTR